MIILLTIVVISPYQTRNIQLVDKIGITQSIGYNLWKGNNSEANVEGKYYTDLNIIEQINKVPKDKYYDINHDKIYKQALHKIIMVLYEALGWSEPTDASKTIERFF